MHHHLKCHSFDYLQQQGEKQNYEKNYTVVPLNFVKKRNIKKQI